MKPAPGSTRPRYPIRNRKDLENALRDYGRVPDDKKAGVMAFIRKRAAALGLTSVVDNWGKGGSK